MTVEVRRRLALGLTAAAVATVTVTVHAAVNGGPGRGGHVYLWPLARPFLGVAIAGAMVAAAAQLAVQHRARRLSSQAAAALIAAAALCLGTLDHGLDMFALSGGSVVAASADFEVVSYRSPGFFSSDMVVLRLRTRDGIASREGRDDVACFISPTSGAGPQWLFDRAEVTGDDEIAVVAKDGTTWRIRFSTRTLRCRPARQVHRRPRRPGRLIRCARMGRTGRPSHLPGRSSLSTPPDR
jgi:hypothetical protein